MCLIPHPGVALSIVDDLVNVDFTASHPLPVSHTPSTVLNYTNGSHNKNIGQEYSETALFFKDSNRMLLCHVIKYCQDIL